MIIIILILNTTTTNNNESNEVQTLGTIRIQLYHQCFEQVQQHNFTSIIDLLRSTQRPSIFEGRHIDHPSSKVDTSIVDLRKSTHRSSKVDTSIIDFRRPTHRSSKIEGGNIALTTQHRTDIPDHPSSKVDTSIVDLRKSTHRSSKVDTSIIDLRRPTHRSSKIEGGNIALTTQHCTDIPTVRHQILSTIRRSIYPRFRVV